MPYTPQEIAERVRIRLGTDVSIRPKYQAMIKDALQALSNNVALNKHKKNLLLATTTRTLDAGGKTDLSAIITATPFINLERIRYGAIYTEGSDYPLGWIEPQQKNLPDDLDDLFVNCYLEGNILYVKDGEENTVLNLSAPRVPTLDDLPSALLDDLINEIINIVKTGETDDF